MKFLLITLKALALLFVVLLVASFFLPEKTAVSRSVDISAPPEAVYTKIDNFQSFNQWSPWAGVDPDTQYQFSGPERGTGAVMTWESENPQVGSGRQEIIAAEPGRSLTTHLDFGKQGNAEASFLLEPTGDGTRITWGFETHWGYNPIGRYMGLMMDKWVGSEYEKGLASLKSLVESSQ